MLEAKARAWAQGITVTKPSEAIEMINLYVLCERFNALPSEVLKEDPDVLRAFQIIHNARAAAQR